MAQLQAQLINAQNHSAQNSNNNDIETDALRHRCEAEIYMYHSSAFLELQQQVTDEAGNAVVDGNGVGKNKYCNPMEWWKNNEKNYPTLAALVRMYLAIQATSAPSERVFSVASRLISKLRAWILNWQV
jgi:hypothetical protein